MNGPKVARTVGLVGLMLVLQGCSFLYVQGPPEGHAGMESFGCESSYGVPIVDLAVGAGLIVWGATAGETTSDNFGQPVESSATDNLVAGIVFGAPFVAGAGWGARQVSRCRSARGALARRAAEAAEAARGFSPPAPPARH